jgi:thiol-disulfide isomerase/thioredoxin
MYPMNDAAPSQPLPPNRWATVAWIVSSLLLVVLVVGVWLKVSGDRSGANLANAIIAGKRPVAPTLPTKTVFDDGPTAAKIPDDEILVVNWWASWCGPCKDEAPALKEIADDYDGRVTVVGMNAGAQDLRRAARRFADEYKLDFPLVRGARADEDAWGTVGFPETYVVGTDGRISSFVNGPIDEETLRGLLDAELDEDRGAKDAT